MADWEHIVVDDGADGSVAEAVRGVAAGDSRVRYIARTGEKAGANVCRNLGIAHSASELVVLLDDDDLLRPDCLARRVEVMQRNADIDFAIFRARIFVKNVGDPGTLYHPQEPSDDLLRFLSLECPWQTSGPIWRRSFLQTIGGFDEDLFSMQDLELHVRALATRPRYLCFRDADHDIRAEIDPTRTSTRHFRDPVYLRRAECIPGSLLELTRKAGLLTWSRCRAVLGLSYGVAESWARIGELGEAMRTWGNACRDMSAPSFLAFQGRAMLVLTRFSSSQTGVAARLANRWKGEVRFRQEPALTGYGDSRGSTNL